MSTIIELPDETGWSATTGYTRTRTWEYHVADESTFTSTILPDGFISISRRFDKWSSDGTKGKVTYSATYASQTLGTPTEAGLIQRVWTLHSGENIQQIVAHPNFKAMLDADTTNHDWPYRVQKAVEAYKTAWQLWITKYDVDIAPPEPVLSTYTALVTAPTSDSTLLGYRDNLILMLKASDNPTFIEPTHSLRKSEVVIASSDVKAAYANINKVFSYAGLIAHDATLADSGLIVTTGLSSYYWFKKAVSVEQIQGGRFQIVTEYESVAYYPVFLYGSPITS